jgi:hypothetical protein
MICNYNINIALKLCQCLILYYGLMKISVMGTKKACSKLNRLWWVKKYRLLRGINVDKLFFGLIPYVKVV